jgi:hypothetical protein
VAAPLLSHLNRERLISLKHNLFEGLRVEGRLFVDWMSKKNHESTYLRYRQLRFIVGRLRNAFARAVEDFRFATQILRPSAVP